MSLEDIQQDQHQGEANIDSIIETKPKQKKKAGCGWLIALLFLLLVGAGVGAYYYYQQEKEKTAYALLENNEHLEDYEAYLKYHPNGEHATEVKLRLETLRTMYTEWGRVHNSIYASDFERFKRTYPMSLLAKQCDLKIDSLDWMLAQKVNTSEAFAAYIEKHPDGRYLSEAVAAQSLAQSTEVSDLDRQEVARTLKGFYTAFGNNDEAELCLYIAPIMTQFLTKRNATKADIVDLVARTYSDHIQSCRFTLGNDITIKKNVDAEGQNNFEVAFSVDQHISRDNEGKTFGSYTAKAMLNAAYQLTSLQMKEVSRAEGEGKTTLQSVAKSILNAITQ